MSASDSTSPRRLILLGSTGSIGTNTVDVIEHLRAETSVRFDVVGLAAGSNAQVLAEQARRLGVEHVAIANEKQASEISSDAQIYAGADAALELIEAVAQPGDLVVGAMVGSSGLPATLAAIHCRCDIALANKETLVAAGSLVMPAVREKNVHLIPIDSEHSAIFQCLLAGRSIEEVKKLVITASGGPFRTWPIERMHAASVQEALAHPTWNMGRKVTIDSASLMNKALEVIEAHWLFGLEADRIDAIIHPQSVIHSFVEFVDNSVIAQLGPPDMRTPIQYALTWPDRQFGRSKAMNWHDLRSLEFEPHDSQRFPAIDLAKRVIHSGGSAGAIFNAANEAAVEAFLDRRIPFGRISSLVAEALDSIPSSPIQSLADVLAADREARAFIVERCLASGAGASRSAVQ